MIFSHKSNDTTGVSRKIVALDASFQIWVLLVPFCGDERFMILIMGLVSLAVYAYAYA